MNRMEPKLKAGDMDIVEVFHNENILLENEYQWFCCLGNNWQAIKPKFTGRCMMVSEFVCTRHGKMVD